MCDLYDSFLASEDKLRFRRSQTKQSFCREKKELPVGTSARKKTPLFMSTTEKEKEIKREKKRVTNTVEA